MGANQMLAGYLFQPDKHYETSLDTGDKTIQCGRHVDIVKLWLAWKARGNQGYAEHIEGLLEKANFFYGTISKRLPYFRMVMKVKERFYLIDSQSSSLFDLATFYQCLLLVYSRKFTKSRSSNYRIQSTIGSSKSHHSRDNGLLFSPEGRSTNKRTYDDQWDDDGRLSTSRSSPEFLPCNHLESCHHQRGHSCNDRGNS